MTTATRTTTDPAELLDQRAATWETQARSLLDTATAAARPLTDDERRHFDSLVADAAALRSEIATIRTATVARVVTASTIERHDTATDVSDDRTRPLTRSQSVVDWSRRHEPHLHTEATQDVSFGRMIRGLVTGDWTDAEREQRAMSVGTLAAGGHMVPTPVAADIIDRARNTMRIVQAGARTVPMTASTLKIARLDTDPTAAWHTENTAITPSDPTFGAVTFTAQTLTVLTQMSFELFEDVDNIDQVMSDAIAQSIALEVDRVGLRGSGTAPEPRGVRNQAGVTISLSFGANGAAPTNYDHLIDAYQTLRAGNFEPTGHIVAPRTATTYAKFKDSTNQSLQLPPAVVAAGPILQTNQIGVTTTVGTSNDTSDIYVAQWDHLLIGLRTSFNVRLLTERYADNGQFALLAYLRADIQLARAGAFCVVAGARP